MTIKEIILVILTIIAWSGKIAMDAYGKKQAGIKRNAVNDKGSATTNKAILLGLTLLPVAIIIDLVTSTEIIDKYFVVLIAANFAALALNLTSKSSREPVIQSDQRKEHSDKILKEQQEIIRLLRQELNDVVSASRKRVSNLTLEQFKVMYEQVSKSSSNNNEGQN